MSDSISYRDKIGEISAAMAKIHKLLLEDEMESRELASNKVIPPAERLNALLNDPSLAWMRAMSQLMAFVDEIYFQKEPVLERQMNEIEEKVHSLLSLQNETEFTYCYRARLGTIPNLMVEHGNLRSILKRKASS